MLSAVLQRQDSGEAFDQYSNHCFAGKKILAGEAEISGRTGEGRDQFGAPYGLQPKLVLEEMRHFKRMA